MDNPAGISDLQARWSGPSDFPSLIAEVRLAEAWRALQAEGAMRQAPTLVSRLEAGDPDLLLLTVDVVCSAALRVLDNPAGYTDEAESIDDYQHSAKRDPSTISNDLYFTAAELRRLLPPGKSSSEAFTIRPGGRPRRVCW